MKLVRDGKIVKAEKLNVPGFMITRELGDGCSYYSKSRGLVVIQSVSKELDGKLWLHTSYSRKSKLPSYYDTQFIKKHFIGEDQKAIAVYPKKSEHVNIMPYCLHLWTCLDGDPLPDFTHGSGSI
jgi:hypothetical protein